MKKILVRYAMNVDFCNVLLFWCFFRTLLLNCPERRVFNGLWIFDSLTCRRSEGINFHDWPRVYLFHCCKNSSSFDSRENHTTCKFNFRQNLEIFDFMTNQFEHNKVKFFLDEIKISRVSFKFLLYLLIFYYLIYSYHRGSEPPSP